MAGGARYTCDFDGVQYVCERCEGGVVVITVIQLKRTVKKTKRGKPYKRVKRIVVDDDS